MQRNLLAHAKWEQLPGNQISCCYVAIITIIPEIETKEQMQLGDWLHTA